MENTLSKRYDEAIQSFVDKVQSDPNVVAVIVYGSVSHGLVWEKSDIDMTVVVRDQKLTQTQFGIYEDHILLNVDLCQRSDMKRNMEKSLTGSTGHSFGAASKIIYTRDDSLYEYFEDYKQVGRSDVEKELFHLANWLISDMEKIEKWLVVKRDPVYSRYYILKAADVIAQMEVCSRYQVPTREAILQARGLNPRLMDKFYDQPMSRAMSEEEIYGLLGDMDAYIMTHQDAIVNVLADIFGDGEIKTGTQISRYFQSSMHALHPILDFACEKGFLDKISQTIRLTPKSRPAVEEVAFIAGERLNAEKGGADNAN